MGLRVLVLIALLGVLAWILLEAFGSRAARQADRRERQPARPAQSSAIDEVFTVTRSRPLPRQEPATAPEVVGRARQYLESGGRHERCGPYALLSDVRDAGLLGICERLGLELDAAYENRFGVRPLGQPAATVLLFANRDGYRGFAEEEGMAKAGYAGYSRPDRGYTAIWADATRQQSFATTLAHELTHLVHRRALGGGLLRWLSEGLADWLDSATPLATRPGA